MQTVERPRFRQDLVAEATEEGGHKFIDVGDPDSGNMFRFYEVEFSLACGMDGDRDVAGIVQWAKDELGLAPSAKEVREVIATLARLSFLDQGPAARAAATERPTPTAAAAARDTELAAGVVVAQQQQRRQPAGIDVELGSAGAKAPAAAQPLPKAAEFDLGAPGAAPVAAKPSRVPVEDLGLGAPGARSAQPAAAKSDVSLDLADHVGVKPADVKEAVRQSKQIGAVDVPKELLEQAEAPVPPPKVEQPRPVAKPVEAKPVAKPVEAKPVEAKPVAAEKPVAKPVAAKPVAAEKPVEARPAAQKPVEKRPAEKPVVAEKRPAKPPAPRPGVSPLLIILLVLAVGGAGAYFAWRYLIRGKSEPTEATQPPVTPGSGPSAVTPPAPAAPPAPKAKIEVVPGAQRDILSVFGGTIESIDTAERDVDTSDVLAKLVGAKKLEAEIAAADKEIEKRKTALKAARDAREKLNPPAAEGSAEAPKPPSEAQLKAADAAIEKAQTALEAKQNERGTKEEELEKLYVRAPFEGHVTVVAKQGQKVEENTTIAKIVPKPAPTATFKLYKNMTVDRGLAVPLKVGEKMYTCEVADSNVDGTTVVCRTNAADLAAGAEATLMIDQGVVEPGETAPAPGAAPAAPGSAAPPAK